MDVQPWSLHQLDQLDEDKDSSTVLGIIERSQRERDIIASKSSSSSQNNNAFRRTSFLPKITYSTKSIKGGYTKNVRRFGSFENLLVPNPDDDGLSSSISLNEVAANNNPESRKTPSNHHQHHHQDVSMNTFHKNGDSDSEYGEVTTSAFNAPDTHAGEGQQQGPPVVKTTMTTSNRNNTNNITNTKSNTGASGKGTGYVQYDTYF